ncbi:MAG: formate dehydrogenase accessory protein FdhE [Thermomicrobiales bacterium]
MPIRVSGDARQQMEKLAEAHPEWSAWLSLYRATLDADADPVWQHAADAANVLVAENRARALPLLAGATMTLPAGLASRWLHDLHPAATGIDAEAAFTASINQDHEHLAALAVAAVIDAETIEVIAHLAAQPLLRACGRRLADQIPTGWDHGACPICGAWPTLAEMRGLERARRLRCGRCGADWGLVAFRCPYCGMADHRQLGSLVSEENAEAQRVETCLACHGYLKSIATLLPWSAEETPLADLATVDLDLAAREHGYDRPSAPAFDLGILVMTTSIAANGAGPHDR